MKIFAQEFNPIKWMKGWKTLSVQTRSRFIINIDSTLKVRDDVFTTEQIDELFNAGFLLPNRSMLAREVRPFRNMVRSLYRHRRIFTSDSGPDYEYVTDHITPDDSIFIAGKRGRYYRSHLPDDVVEIINSTTWLENFLAADTPTEWEPQKGLYLSYAMDPDAFTLLKKWITDVRDGDNPVDLLDLLESDKKNEPIALDALRGGVRYMTFFIGLDPKQLDITAGILPKIRSELNRVQSEKPECCPTPPEATTFEFPSTLYDVKTLLMETCGEGVRLKANRKIFKKEETRIAAQLISPLKNSKLVKISQSSERISTAQTWIECLELAAAPYRVKKGETLYLKITENGKDWLNGSTAEQLKLLAEYMQHELKTEEPQYRYLPTVSYLPFNPVEYIGERRIVAKAVAQAFASIPVGSWMNLPDFLRWHSESVNPLIAAINGICEAPLPFWCEDLSRKESNWSNVLEAFLFDRLMVTGGARMGSDNDTPVFSITPMGAYIIGATDHFECTLRDEASGIIVQPNFEIIFTEVNPIAESNILQYAERVGKSIGVLFKITKDSIMRSLDNEMRGEQIIESLRNCSSIELPKNVVIQISDWCRTYRVAKFEKIQVINCPDAETAMHVHALFPKETEILGDTIVKISTKKTLSALKNKLKDNGIGLLG